MIQSATVTVLTRATRGFLVGRDASGRVWGVMGKRGEWVVQLMEKGAAQTVHATQEAARQFIAAQRVEVAQ